MIHWNHLNEEFKHHAGFNMMERRLISNLIVTGLIQMTVCLNTWASDLNVQGFNTKSESCQIDIQYDPEKPLETHWLINSSNQTLSQTEECGISNIQNYPGKIIIRAFNPNENVWQDLILVLNDKKEIIFYSETKGANKGDVQASCESFLRIRKYIQFCDVKKVIDLKIESAIPEVTKLKKPKLPTPSDHKESNQQVVTEGKNKIKTEHSKPQFPQDSMKMREANKVPELLE